jgi:TPR repeat protein
MYHLGIGVAVDNQQSAAWFQRCCDEGDAMGCFVFGTMLAQGLGVAKDVRRALEVFRRSCAGGFEAGCSAATY